MFIKRRPVALFAAAFALAFALAACAPANERPVRGAVPGSEAPTPPGVPPTLTASDSLRLRALPTPSAGLAASPSAIAASSPSAAPAPPIVRTIAPSANGRVPAGAPVTLSAVLVGRGADLASASLTINGADAGAEIDKTTPREWSIHASQTLANGTHTAKVFVKDASGAAGGFTWQFLVGEPDPAPTAHPATPAAVPASPTLGGTPVPKPRNP
jgi:hypothetical protein